VDTPTAATFRLASQFFVDAVAAVPRNRYDEPWSDEWRVLDLIGHGNRANVLTVQYYERPVSVAGPDYALPNKVAERGRQAVRALGDDPVSAVRAASERALAVVASAPNDATVGTPFGELTLDAYLQSRIAELVLHGVDLDTGIEPPTEVLAECAVILVKRAVKAGSGMNVVRALSGRCTLPRGFSVY